MGATVIEKHFTLSRADGGVDSAFSLEPHELTALVEESERAWQALGCVNYGPSKAEQKNLLYRRSIYVAKDISKGEIFTQDNLRIVRPGDGLKPSFLRELLGKTCRKNLLQGQPLKANDII